MKESRSVLFDCSNPFWKAASFLKRLRDSVSLRAFLLDVYTLKSLDGIFLVHGNTGYS